VVAKLAAAVDETLVQEVPRVPVPAAADDDAVPPLTTQSNLHYRHELLPTADVSLR